MPNVDILASSTAVAPGLILATPRPPSPRVRSGPMMFDSRGRVVWFHPLGRGYSSANLQVQTYRGRRVLTWGQRPSVATWSSAHHIYDVIADDHYRIIRRVRAAGRDMVTNLHDFVITPRDTALVLGMRRATRDLSAYGGSDRGTVIEDVLQEIDIASGRVLFSWHSLSHVPLADSYERAEPGRPFDYMHMNSVAEDSDGNLLVSGRHTSTVYKIDRESGDIIWRLGGKHSSFAFGPDARFWYQHNAHRLANGLIQVFDNGYGGGHKESGGSRALRLALDTKHHTATLVRQYRHPTGKTAVSQGSVTALPNSDVLVGWGSLPRISEFSFDGRDLWEATLPNGHWQSYRAAKAEWTGRPLGSPSLRAAGSGSAPSTLVFASWNGATDVADWRVYAGSSETALEPVGIARYAGFETRITVPGRPGYVRVDALDARGHTIARSPVAAVQTR